MSKVTCRVIGDLLPLYVEDVLSEDSRGLVEEHLAGCDKCRAELEAMRKPLAVPDFREADRENLRRLRRALRRKRLRSVLAAVIATVAVLGAVWAVQQPTSVGEVLEREKHPLFAAGEILVQEAVDDHRTFVIYRNRQEPDHLLQVVIGRKGPFYESEGAVGYLTLEAPRTLEEGELRSRMQWTALTKKPPQTYGTTVVVYDEVVDRVECHGEPLQELEVDGCRVFWGVGLGDEYDYQLLDADGRELSHYYE